MERVGSEKIERKEGHLYYVGGDGNVYEVARGRKGSKMRISKSPVKRESGYLYFVDKSGYVSRAKMSRGKRARAKG